MVPLVALYRLSCACGQAVPVAVGRAGGAIDCPRCGTPLPVPKLRRLRELPVWHDSPQSIADGPQGTGGQGTGGEDGGWRHRGGEAGGGWGRSEAVLAAGALIATASLLVAAWLMRPVSSGIDADVIRDVVGQAPASDIYRAWRSLAASGVARGATPDEDRVRRITRNRAALAVAVGLLGAIGGLTAVGAAAAIVARSWTGRQRGRGSEGGNSS